MRCMSWFSCYGDLGSSRVNTVVNCCAILISQTYNVCVTALFPNIFFIDNTVLNALSEVVKTPKSCRGLHC